MTIGIAILGAGRIGRMHAENLAAHPDFRLRAIHDPDAAAAESAAAKMDDVAVAQTAEDALDRGDIRAVLVASPTPTHCEFILQAARRGLAVLCEKPVDLDLDRANQCRDALKKLGAKTPPVQIGFNRRFDPGHSALRERVRRGDIGKLEQLVISSRDPAPPHLENLRVSGGIFKDMMIHDLDLARFILPDEPKSVMAEGSVLIDPRVVELNDVDSAMVVMRTESGVLCCINNSRRACYGYDQRVEAHGEKGMLLSDNRPETGVKFFGESAVAVRDPLPHFFIERYAKAYRTQLDSFARVVSGETAPSPSFEDGRRALVLAEAAGTALREKRAVAAEF